MMELYLPKNYVNILAGLVNLAFEKLSKSLAVAITVDVVADSPAESLADEPDDLTAINGIGPTFASRLTAAGIDTYQKLAAESPERVKAAAKLQNWQADPAHWIAEAKELA